MGMFEVQTLTHAANFNVEIPADAFQCHLFARVTNRKIDFAKSADTHAALDGVSIQRARPGGKGEPHVGGSHSGAIGRCGATSLAALI
jgi:hypothetical protein